jgi:hypothetical protein
MPIEISGPKEIRMAQLIGTHSNADTSPNILDGATAEAVVVIRVGDAAEEDESVQPRIALNCWLW